jgi:hypothetical protein
MKPRLFFPKVRIEHHESLAIIDVRGLKENRRKQAVPDRRRAPALSVDAAARIRVAIRVFDWRRMH